MMCSYKEFKWKHLCEKCESFHVNVTKRIRVVTNIVLDSLSIYKTLIKSNTSYIVL